MNHYNNIFFFREAFENILSNRYFFWIIVFFHAIPYYSVLSNRYFFWIIVFSLIVVWMTIRDSFYRSSPFPKSPMQSMTWIFMEKLAMIAEILPSGFKHSSFWKNKVINRFIYMYIHIYICTYNTYIILTERRSFPASSSSLGTKVPKPWR